MNHTILIAQTQIAKLGLMFMQGKEKQNHANSSKNDNGDCTVSTIFSAKESACPACHRSIKRVSVALYFNLKTCFSLSYYHYFRVKYWQHSMKVAPGSVADGTASAETITCARRCDIDSDATKFINICGKVEEQRGSGL